jgi:hypothetical protein
MSSVVISGDTSGAITLSAPLVAGTNTINLPAAAGTVMVSGNMPTFSAYQASPQTVTNSVFTKVTFDTEVFDTNSNFASSRFTPTVAGYYQLNWCIYPASSTTSSLARLYKNGSFFYNPYAGSGLVNALSGGSGLVYMNGSTDYLEIYVYLAGASPTLQEGATWTYFNGSMVRGA